MQKLQRKASFKKKKTYEMARQIDTLTETNMLMHRKQERVIQHKPRSLDSHHERKKENWGSIYRGALTRPDVLLQAADGGGYLLEGKVEEYERRRRDRNET